MARGRGNNPRAACTHWPGAAPRISGPGTASSTQWRPAPGGGLELLLQSRGEAEVRLHCLEYGSN